MLSHQFEETGAGISRRIGFAVIGLLSTAALYAEGVLKNGLLEVPLLIPILWVMVSPLFANREKGMMIVLSMACLTLVACDLLARPFAAPYLHYNPANMFSRKLPNLSILGRWDTNVNYRGQAYGDLAAMKGEKEWREIREVVFQTDQLGFRNGTIHEPNDLIGMASPRPSKDERRLYPIAVGILALAIAIANEDYRCQFPVAYKLFSVSQCLQKRQSRCVLSSA